MTSQKTVVFSLTGLLMALLLVLSFGLFRSQAKIRTLQIANPEMISERENDALYVKVKRLVALPDEKPVVRTVSAADKVKNEPFYARAQVGDKVLVFSQQAILYSPSLDRVMEIGNVLDDK
jgi:hypothetical protein